MLPKYHLVSFSGGKDSTAMLLHMMELGYKIDEVLSCDTGVEFPEMYQHIKKVRQIVEKAGIKFTILKAEKSFEYYLIHHEYKDKKGYSWATPVSRWCTSFLKRDVIKKYLATLNKRYKVVQYVGLAHDEQYRIEREAAKGHIHPLADWGWDEAKALKYCYSRGLTWHGLYKERYRVSCWCCPLQDLAGLRSLYFHHRPLWLRLKEWDSQTRTPFRLDYSLKQLEKRFIIEKIRQEKGLTINPHSNEFRLILNRIKGKRLTND